MGESRRVRVDGVGQRARRAYRQARRWFHMLVGVAFLVLAGLGATVSLAEWKFYRDAPAAGVWRFSLLAGFTVLLFIFGLYSFLKARSVR